jgi:secretion/DNA translocation related TadE-like protein
VKRWADARGSASVLVVAVTGLLLVMGAALGVVGAMVRAHRVAQAGADLAALAGAHGLAQGRDGCADARRIAAANGVRLASCAVEGRDVSVTVVARGPHWLGETADLAAQARAGPG